MIVSNDNMTNDITINMIGPAKRNKHEIRKQHNKETTTNKTEIT